MASRTWSLRVLLRRASSKGACCCWPCSLGIAAAAEIAGNLFGLKVIVDLGDAGEVGLGLMGRILEWKVLGGFNATMDMMDSVIPHSLITLMFLVRFGLVGLVL